MTLVCFGCGRKLDVGDHYIKDTVGGFAADMGIEGVEGGVTPGGSEVDKLLGRVLSGTDDGTIVFCEDCTEETDDGRYLFDTVYGDEDEEEEEGNDD